MKRTLVLRFYCVHHQKYRSFHPSSYIISAISEEIYSYGAISRHLKASGGVRKKQTA